MLGKVIFKSDSCEPTCTVEDPDLELTGGGGAGGGGGEERVAFYA